jgi:hypothetical protein
VTDPAGDLEACRARLRVLEDLARTMADALAMVPASAIGSGAQWMPSPEAVALIEFAQDRWAEYEA